MEHPENKLTDLINSSEKAKWRPVNNHNINNFTEDEIKRITNNYSTVIGKGGFGQVYKGFLDDGTRTPVAVKKYMRHNLTEWFSKEIIVHCQINHKNVVRLLGCCMEENALMIVTEYVLGGNLGDFLHGSEDPISLDVRLRIAIECADALGYMHSSMYQPIIHGDIKPDNVLLDSNLGVKLADFGLSRLLCIDKTQYTINVRGSIGYIDPEYTETGIVHPKSDVYSFGVFLLELITRSKASESGFNITNLKRNFTDALRKGKEEARKMFDSDISDEGNIDILDGIGNLAAECFKREIKERPEMKDVRERLQMLRRALHLEHPQEKIGRREGSLGETQDTTDNVNNHNINNFTEDEIKRITNSYSTLIGEGVFGQVYKGVLDDGTAVAVKRYMRQNLTRGFGMEVIVHYCQIDHKNIVRLLGCCREENAFMIVIEYVSGGNLHDLLHGSDNSISLDERLRIAIECADALGYMHSMYQPIIHGDVKPDDILLDSKLGVKLSDFELSRLLSMDKTQYTRTVLGSIGYMDPEYIDTGIVDPKSDVYSFGVVLLELITRSKASESGCSTHLDRNFTDALRKGKKAARKMFDTEIVANDKYTDILDGIGNLAAECLAKGMKERPEMKKVQERLQFLRRALHREQAQEKFGQRSSILGIFNGNNARIKRFKRNGGLILQGTSGLTIFTEQSLETITRNYSDLIGRGSSICVHAGWIADGTMVAVMRPTTLEDEVVNAVQSACRISHRNIIRLVGCCLETVVPVFVYEFAANGSLHDVLHDGYGYGKLCLPLDPRLKIAIGSAKALAYVHSVRPAQIVHGNITSRNILLDHGFVPKISGSFFKIRNAESLWGISSDTRYYVDPVYTRTGVFTAKSDVYSFGIVLLELITGTKLKKNDHSLRTDYLKVWNEENSGEAMFDKAIAFGRNFAILEEMGKIAVECLKEDADERPEMVEVAERLQKLRPPKNKV